MRRSAPLFQGAENHMQVRRFPSTQGGPTRYRFDFSISDFSRRGVVSEGVTVNVSASAERDQHGMVTASEDLVARRAVERLLRQALAELRKAPD